MSWLIFPDVNVWLALATAEHVHAAAARAWWEQETGDIAFSRFTQLGFLRLMTTAAVMDGKPLTMKEAWRVFDRFFEDDRVVFTAEPADVETRFRKYTAGRRISPKVWADAWLLAFAQTALGTLVTFDRALAARGARCLLPEKK
jgi:toxin-antitoxin system PIN domain toxin